MRVLHVITTLDPSAGGPPAVALRLGAAQACAGAQVAICSYSHPEAAERTTRSLAGIPGIERVRLVPVEPEKGVLGAITARQAARILAEETARADVVHLHGVWDPILRCASALARRAGRPYVITPHGMLDPWSMRQGGLKRLKKKVALMFGYRAMLNHAAFLHTLNRDERDLLRPLGLRCDIEVVPNGIFPDEFAALPGPERFCELHPELENTPYVLFLSRIHFKKGLDYLADAFALLTKARAAVRLVVAGPDDGELPAFVARCELLGISRSVHVVGALYGAEKLAALRGASCFCLPSRQEGFSMAITEAMACGTPVVISTACHFPEVEEEGAGIVVPLEAARVADALLLVLGDKGRADAMGRAGRALVEARYTWEKIANVMLDAYARHTPPGERTDKPGAQEPHGS